jgi:hypothetical protein
VRELAKWFGVSVQYIYAAMSASNDFAKRLAILHGDLPLVAEARRKLVTETLDEHYARSSAAQKLEAARKIGARVIWDEMVNPLV